MKRKTETLIRCKNVTEYGTFHYYGKTNGDVFWLEEWQGIKRTSVQYFLTEEDMMERINELIMMI